LSYAALVCRVWAAVSEQFCALVNAAVRVGTEDTAFMRYNDGAVPHLEPHAQQVVGPLDGPEADDPSRTCYAAVFELKQA
jgi:hypothetical protein